MSAPKKKCRQYSTEYLKYGFIELPGNKNLPLCLSCAKSLSNESMKPPRLMDHLKRIHPEKSDRPVQYFAELEAKYERRVTVGLLIAKATKKNDKGLLAFYKVSFLIAKSSKPHTIGGELILPAVKEIVDTMFGPSQASQVTDAVPLSNNIVSRRIDEMGANVEDVLCNKLKSREFTVQLDESILSDSTALLLSYVRFIDDNGEMAEKMLFIRSLITDTKGSSIFEVIKRFFEEKEIPLLNMIACATDGAAAMTGRHWGFIAHLKQAVPGILCIHCIIHRDNFAVKNLSGRLHDCLRLVIDAPCVRMNSFVPDTLLNNCVIVERRMHKEINTSKLIRYKYTPQMAAQLVSFSARCS
ncbi:zinc finger MYM-type protein 6-like [Diabrotica undecimpunctata]|uniref:zinc finger MYM-type protein 6-like n=1 Tax=Diabrotica undecimpunctata TaxID=50387 RepID=UPI003B641216